MNLYNNIFYAQIMGTFGKIENEFHCEYRIHSKAFKNNVTNFFVLFKRFKKYFKWFENDNFVEFFGIPL
jgi:hypothetical protein